MYPIFNIQLKLKYNEFMFYLIDHQKSSKEHTIKSTQKPTKIFIKKSTQNIVTSEDI